MSINPYQSPADVARAAEFEHRDDDFELPIAGFQGTPEEIEKKV